VDELRDLAAQVIDGTGSPEQPFGLYAFASSDELSELPRSVERRAFDEFFGNSPELLDAEYGPYEPATVFLCVLDHRRRLPAGMLRVIFPSPAGLKSLADIEPVWKQPLADVLARTDPPVELARALDIATLAIAPDYRGRAADGLVSLSLYQAATQAAMMTNVRWAVTILDTRVLNLIQRSIGEPFSYFPGIQPLEYLGSAASLPVVCDFPTYFERLEANDPSMREIIADGRGLESAVRPTTWGDALADVGAPRLRIA
jgi:hypothetical protein